MQNTLDPVGHGEISYLQFYNNFVAIIVATTIRLQHSSAFI